MRYRDMRALGLPTKKTDEQRHKMRAEAMRQHREIMRAYSMRRQAEAAERVSRTIKTPEGITGPTCYWCGRDTDSRRLDSPHMLTRDHLTPRKFGYASLFSVIVPAHKLCNGMRGHEADGPWVKFPDWRACPEKMPRSQRSAFARLGVTA